MSLKTATQYESADEPESEPSDLEQSAEDAASDDEHDNSGWANVMAKLRKKNANSGGFLSQHKAPVKSKEEKRVTKAAPTSGFEIVDASGQKCVELVAPTSKARAKIETVAEDSDNERPARRKPQLELRAKPSWQDIEKERALQKKARMGVVQLFNAIRNQQRDLKQQLAEAGPLESKRDAVLNSISKRKFLDVLMSGNKTDSADKPKRAKQAADDDDDNDSGSGDDDNGKRKSEWSVLQPDFMTNKKNKHWDEENSSEDDAAQSDDADSDE